MSEVAGRLLEVFARPVPLLEGAAEAGDRLAVPPVLYHLVRRHLVVADPAAGPLHARALAHRAGGGGRG